MGCHEREGRFVTASVWTSPSRACSLVDPLQVAMDNGARRALIPMENKSNFFDVSAEVLEAIDPIFFGDVWQGAMKGLGLG